MKSKAKKIISVIFAVITTLLLVAAAAVMFTVLSARAKGETPSLFGYSFHLVQTGSMAPEINVGDLVIAKKVDNSEIQRDDDIVFVTTDPSLNGITIVHRVKDVTEEGFTTSGIADGAREDKYPVVQPIGKVVKVSVFWGEVFTFLTKGKNAVFALLLVVLLAIAAAESVSLAKQFGKNKARQR